MHINVGLLLDFGPIAAAFRAFGVIDFATARFDDMPVWGSATPHAPSIVKRKHRLQTNPLTGTMSAPNLCKLSVSFRLDCGGKA